MHCWFVDVEYANGAIGHLDLTVAVRMGWHEGFQIYGQNGSKELINIANAILRELEENG